MKVKGVIIHCSDSPQGRGDDITTLHRWHTQKGWSGVGYHYVILEDGTIQKGRPNFWDGSHARGYNGSHLGICLIGEDYFTKEQYYSLKDLLSSLMLEFNIDKKDILGHFEVSTKTCPNFDVPKWIRDNL